MVTSVIRRRLTPEDRVETPYLALPFEVTGSDASVEVSLEYDTSAAVIDLGCEGAAGWRGWSGGARSSFVIAENAATPGYLPGPLEAGEWAVVLGLHKVPESVDVVVRVSVPAMREPEPEPSGPPPDEPRRARDSRSLPGRDGLTWFAGDFHSHSLHSDGSLSLSQLAAEAVGTGLDFLAVTDHNTVSHHRLLPEIGARYGIGLIPGQEVTTARGHANAFGAIPWVDFRRHPDAWVRHVEAAGGILSINHPVGDDCSWQWALTDRPAYAELLHSSWLGDRENTNIWAWWNAWAAATVPLGGSDFHRPGEGIRPGMPTTWVLAEEPTPDAVLAAVKGGRTALTAQPQAPAVIRLGDEILAVDAEGTIASDMTGRRRLVGADREALPAHWEAPVRLETTRREILAITG